MSVPSPRRSWLSIAVLFSAATFVAGWLIVARRKALLRAAAPDPIALDPPPAVVAHPIEQLPPVAAAATPPAPARDDRRVAGVWFLLLAALCLAWSLALNNSSEGVFQSLAGLPLVAALACGVGFLGTQLYHRRRRHLVWPKWLWRLLGIFAALMLSFVAADLNFHADQFQPDVQLATTLLWVAAVVIAAVSAGIKHNDPPVLVPREPVTRWEILGLIGLIGVAFALRAIDLEHVPGIVMGDESKYGLTAQYLTSHVVTKPFSTSTDGHWNLYFMVIGVFIQALGATLTAVRMPSALAGALSIFCTYLVVRQLWGRRPAFIAAALLTAYHHHLHYSRLGFNSIDDPLMTMLTFACLWLAWRTGRRQAWLMTAVAIGLAQYFFVGGRLVLLQVTVLGIFWLITSPRKVRAQALNMALAIGVFLCLVLPIVYFLILRPNDYMASFNAKNIFLSGWLPAEMAATQQSAGQVILQQARDVLYAVSVTSAEAFYWNQVMLTPIMTVLAVAALLYFLRHAGDERYFWVLSSLLLLFVLGGVLMVDPKAGAHRLVGGDPFIYMAIAVLLNAGFERLERYWPRPRLNAATAIALVAILMAGDLHYYFADYLGNHILDSPDVQMYAIHQYLIDYQHQQPDDQPLQIVCVGFSGDYCAGTNLQYFVPQLLARARVTTDVASIASIPDAPEREIVIVNPFLSDTVTAAQERYGAGQRHHGPRGELLFITYELPPGSQ